MTSPALGPPHELLHVTDPVRAFAGLAAWPLSLAVMRRASHADGRPVLVLPGLLAGDLSTRPLRNMLYRTGSHVHGWHLGRNIGPTQHSPLALDRTPVRGRPGPEPDDVPGRGGQLQPLVLPQLSQT